MAFILSDRVKETTTTTGTGTVTLGGTIDASKTFSAAIGDGNSTYYCIESPDGNFEVGVGTYTSSSNTLSRDTVISSSNGGSKISLVGVSNVFCTQPGPKAVFINTVGLVSGVNGSFQGFSFPDGTIQYTSATSGNAPTTMQRQNEGILFNYFVNNAYDETVSLHLENEQFPRFKLGLRDSPDGNSAPTYGYLFGEQGYAGGVADSTSEFFIANNNGFWIKHASQNIANFAQDDGIVFQNVAAASPAFTVKGNAAQATDLQRWSDNSSTTLAKVTKEGHISGVQLHTPTISFADGTTQTTAGYTGTGDINVNQYIYHNGDSNTYIRFRGDQLDFVTGGRTMLTLDEASNDKVIVNDGGHDVDFQVEGQNDANLIRTDAANDRVGIGTSSPSYLLDVAGSGSFEGIRFSDGTTQATSFAADVATASGALRADITTNTAAIPASGYAISGALQSQIDSLGGASISYVDAATASGVANSGFLSEELHEISGVGGLIANKSNWDTAYGWGDHSSAGYLTSQTSHADVVVDGDFSSQGLMKRGFSGGSYSIVTDNSSNWNTAYSWGDHSTQSYTNLGYVSGIVANSGYAISGALQSQIDGLSVGSDSFTSESGVAHSGFFSEELHNISGVGGLIANKSNWDTAYGWGNHASAGYLTSQTSHTDVVVDGDFGSEGLMKRGASGGSYSIVTDNSSNWNTAHGWGNHASAGYAALASPTFTGTPAAPTAAAATNTTQIATTAFVRTEISNLVDSAPGALDTLNELAAAINDDASFSTTVTNSIATKIGNVVEDTSPQLGGQLDANGQSIDMGTNTITDTKVGQWDTAYGWGNHASAGYISATLTTEQVQDIVGAMFSGNTETNITATYEDGDGTIDLVSTDTTYSAGNGIALSSTTFSVSAGNGLAQDSDGLKLDDPANLTELTESTDATDDKILLWDEDASTWKYMTLDNLQDSIDTTGGGGGGGSVTTVKANGSQVGGADIVTLDFSSDFTVSETPDTEINISIGTLNQNTTGSAATLTTARNINGVAFDGSANITVTAAGSTLSDTVPVSKGGTGATALDDKAVLITQDTGTDTVSAAVMDANGELLIGGTSGPAVGTLTAGTNITITNSDGGITIASTDTNTQLSDEQVQDIVGAMVASNTETGITVTYQDADGTLDFAVGTLNQDTSGNAATATALETARNINGVAFDGTGNITITAAGSTLSDTVTVAKGGTGQTTYTNGQLLIGNTTGNTLSKSTLTAGSNITITNGTGSITIAADNDNTQLSDEQVQDIVGAMVTSNTETGITVTYQDADGTLDFAIATLNQDTSGNAATATALETARNINGVSFDGTANITITAAGTTLSDTVPVSKGGTNATSLADKAVLITQDTGTDTVSAAVMDANGELLIGGTSGPAVATLTAGSNITITNADGGITIAADNDNTQLSDEQVQDIVGAMVSSNTESGITVAYQDADGTLDFTVGTLNQDTTGNADTATALATGRTIGMTGDVVWTSASFTGAGNVTGTSTIQADAIETAMIEDDAVTYAKIQNVTATNVVLGRDSAGAGIIEEISAADLRTMINVADGATANAGDITSVVAGDGLTGGATTGDATLNVVGGDGITANANDVAITAAQTTITSVYNASLKMGRDSENLIDFATTDNKIILRANNVDQVSLIDNVFGPEADSDVDLGTTSKRWKDAYVDSLTTTDKITIGGSINQAPNTATDGGAIDIDCGTSNYHEITLNANASSIVFTNATAGQRIIVRFKQHTSHVDLDSNDGFDTVTVNGSAATVTWPGGTIPTLTEANDAVDVYGFLFQDTVTNVHAFIIGQNLS